MEQHSVAGSNQHRYSQMHQETGHRGSGPDQAGHAGEEADLKHDQAEEQAARQTGQHATADDSQSLGSYPLFIAARYEISG